MTRNCNHCSKEYVSPLAGEQQHKWDFEFCSYRCFYTHVKPKVEALAKRVGLTIDELRNLYYDCCDCLIGDWFPIERYNPDDPPKRRILGIEYLGLTKFKKRNTDGTGI
jgi:hypothetical protein